LKGLLVGVLEAIEVGLLACPPQNPQAAFEHHPGIATAQGLKHQPLYSGIGDQKKQPLGIERGVQLLTVVYYTHSKEQAKIGVIEIGFCAHSSMREALPYDRMMVMSVQFATCILEPGVQSACNLKQIGY
jgi:hypothetical protein